MSKEALCILGQIWEENEQYDNYENRVAFVAEAGECPMNKEGKSQGPNFLYVDPKAEVSDQNPLPVLSDAFYLDWQRGFPVLHDSMLVCMASQTS